MNFLSSAILINICSYKRELLFVSSTFLFVLLMPLLSVILLINTGLKPISDKLATYNTISNTIQIRDPKTNQVIKKIQTQRIWPVRGVVTLEFGQSDLPYQPLHSGIDIANPQGQIGDPILAFMPGKVIYTGNLSWGFGKHIIIDHGNNITSIYAHLSEIDVSTGDTVLLGQVIGKEGQTGWATGPHLHFQIDIYGIPVNPRTFLGQGDP